MAKLILGLAGEMGSGKGTVAKHIINEHKGSTHRFSTILRDILNRVYLEQSRDNLQTLSTIMRKNFGEDILAKAIYHDTYNDEHDIVVVDGVRRMEDIFYLRDLMFFKLVYIDADIEKRYERIIKRSENTDDSKKSFEEFKESNKDESESQIRDLKNYANYIIDNNGDFPNLYKQVENIFKENLK
ncbi:MAG TPA: AAA family ATPase [Candidatus Moranbacteria bacterium]|nr:AAA family ATPase [Candidatus Moranbacteria bacterium]